ncbi:hypothetical protein L1887_56823 [Cichorium endivia]|nr:hypothetical protein L1887_56823 [Cichorium endivia]
MKGTLKGMLKGKRRKRNGDERRRALDEGRGKEGRRGKATLIDMMDSTQSVGSSQRQTHPRSGELRAEHLSSVGRSVRGSSGDGST